LTRVPLRLVFGAQRYERYIVRPLAAASLDWPTAHDHRAVRVARRATFVRQIRVGAARCVHASRNLLRCHSCHDGARVSLGRSFGLPRRSCAQSFTAASNYLRAFCHRCSRGHVRCSQRPSALPATVGPLIELPVLVSPMYLLQWTRRSWNWSA